MKKNKDYFVIIVYGLLLTAFLLGINNIYGSSIDWLTQHTIIPEYFRNYFYETGKLIPDFAFHLGGGQNIFNLSYYGLMSPIILISYLFPFIDMKIYVSVASIILYLASGILIYKFLHNNNCQRKTGLLLSLLFLSLSPITFHFHYHIMFVWYFPFLIMSFLGVDNYIKNNKSFLLMLGIFLTIMTNYYYGVTSIIVIAIYGIYLLLSKYENLKEFIFECLKASIRVVIPILLAAFILLPTMYSIANTSRVNTIKNTISDLMVFRINQGMYNSFSTGITAIFIIALFGNLISKNIKKQDRFLNITLILVTFVPIFMYVLNGFLYARAKVLIPFIMLYLIALVTFSNKLAKNNIDLKKLFKIITIVTALIIITNFKNTVSFVFLLDVIITFVCIYLFKKDRKLERILIPSIIIVVISSCVNNVESKYVSKDSYLELKKQNSKIEELINTISDNDFYRSDVNSGSNEGMNKVFSYENYNTGIYSSSYNSYYYDFYNFQAGNNIPHRNSLMTEGSNNPLFYTFMGVKYLVSNTNAPLNFEKIESSGDYSLYKNKNAFPIIYAVSDYGSLKQYNNLEFPYNLEYMMNYPVVESNKQNKYSTNIEKIDLKLKDRYKFSLDENKEYTYSLEKPIKNKYLIIAFEVNNNKSCKYGDVSISINGVKNKLTCKGSYYHNKNNKFEYVISSNEEIDKLVVKITKGKYDISNINVYTLENRLPEYKSINNIKIDKKNSTIIGNANIDKDSYIITSLPYDEGFNVYIDGKLVNKEIVNTAFLGFKINKGHHDIKIVYSSPFYKTGLLISSLGFILMLLVLIFERNRTKINSFLKKNKELILYVVFGVLTTIISLLVYYILTNTILDANKKNQLQIANFASWFVSVGFAFVTNKYYVFNDKNSSNIKSLIYFYLARIATLVIDMTLMFVFVSLFHFNDMVIKVIVQVVIIIANYILSKFLVFKGDN